MSHFPLTRAVIASACMFLCMPPVSPVLAQTAQKALKPDLHAGGPKPSLLPNHETTLVTLPGFNLTGTTVTASGAVCTLTSYRVVSDNQITMTIESHREITEKEDGCFLTVHKGSYTTGTYVIVDLTEAEWTEKNAQEGAQAKAKGEAYMAGLGTQWTLHYADGSSESFIVQPADAGQLPDFKTATGVTAKIATTSDNKVVVMTGSCMRSGTLVNGEVKDGTSMGDCKPAGKWTAQKK